MSQATLASRTGLDASLVSRLVRGDRDPSPDALRCLAPALGIDVAELVRGTDAEDKLGEAIDRNKYSDYEAVVAKLVEFESRAREAEARVRQLQETHADERRAKKAALAEAQAAREDARVAREAQANDQANLRALEAQHAERGREVDDANRRVARLTAAYESLRSKVKALQDELASTNKSAKAAALFSTVGAAAGVATLALLFGGDDGSEDETP